MVMDLEIVLLILKEILERADAFVPANDTVGFSEYQFTANSLDQFNGFAIKVVLSTTNESTPVKLKDFRAIALA